MAYCRPNLSVTALCLVWVQPAFAMATSGYSATYLNDVWCNMVGKQLHRQNILVSATLNGKVKSLAKLSLQHPKAIAINSKHDNVRRAVEEYALL